MGLHTFIGHYPVAHARVYDMVVFVLFSVEILTL